MITIQDWKKHFPFDIVRPQQEQAINFALNSFLNDNKKFVVMELSTGIGKSAIAVTISRYIQEFLSKKIDNQYRSGSHILTTQKVLQDQYVKDFGRDLKGPLFSIKSSSNYNCKSYPMQTCAESRRVISIIHGTGNGSLGNFSKCRKECPYTNSKKDFVNQHYGITNFSYFLAETVYSGKILPKDLLVIDEAHNTEGELSRFIEITFSEKFSNDILECQFPKLKKNSSEISQIFKWVKNTYKKHLVRKINDLKIQIETSLSDNLEVESISKQYEKLDKHICKVNRFIEYFDDDNWIVNIEEPKEIGIKNKKKKSRKFVFKPILVNNFSDDFLFKFGKYVLLMSATVVEKDIFCKSIGINLENVAYLSIPSPFLVENKKIHYMPIGSMSKQNIEMSLPKLSKVVEMLINHHKDEKGIIHCVSFKIANYLYNSIKTDRFMIHDSDNRDDVLKQHIDTKKPTILLSPSMTEGVDLKDDLSRFQIICKVPFPYLGDLVIKKRMENDKLWYDYQTAKTIIQAIGRSIRNENDYAETYLLDSDWESYYKRNINMFPIDFRESIQW